MRNYDEIKKVQARFHESQAEDEMERRAADLKKRLLSSGLNEEMAIEELLKWRAEGSPCKDFKPFWVVEHGKD